MTSNNEVFVTIQEEPNSEDVYLTPNSSQCCSGAAKDGNEDAGNEQGTGTNQMKLNKIKSSKDKCQQSASDVSGDQSYAANKNVAEGLMDIALLSANANQLRFLITYNHAEPTFYFSLFLVVLSLVLQLFVGMMLIFKRRQQRRHSRHYVRTNEFLVMGVFMITAINVLLAAFTTANP